MHTPLWMCLAPRLHQGLLPGLQLPRPCRVVLRTEEEGVSGYGHTSEPSAAGRWALGEERTISTESVKLCF